MATAAAPLTGDEAPTLLVIEDDDLTRRAVRRTASRQGFRVLEASRAEDGLTLLAQEEVDVALVDQGLPDFLGVEFIRRARKRHPTVDYILFTGDGDVAIGFAALKQGASDYFTKPIQDPKRFAQVLRRGVEARRLRQENAHLQARGTVVGKGHAEQMLLGHSAQMEEVRALVRRFAPLRAGVFIQGESGVGKDVVARALHAESGRENGSYQPINCAAVPAELFESELFGHEPGAFTGAKGQRRGYFEEAGEGTVFLDEIGDMPLDLQVKLLRVLENRSFRRVGGSRELPFNGRVVAATNKDLQAMVREGTFREDLFYRLSILRIDVPPLREHPEDIVILAYFFAKEEADQVGRNVRAIHPDAMRALMAYHWPGNVRQLRNNVLRMAALAIGDTIGPDGLDPDVLAAGRAAGALAAPAPSPVPAAEVPVDALRFPADLLDQDYRDAKKQVTEAFAEWYLGEALRRSGGNKTRAADMAGLRRPNFVRELKKYGVTVPDDVDA